MWYYIVYLIGIISGGVLYHFLIPNILLSILEERHDKVSELEDEVKVWKEKAVMMVENKYENETREVTCIRLTGGEK